MRWVAGIALLVLGAGACGGSSPTLSKLHSCALPGLAWVPLPEAGVGTDVELSCPGAIGDYCGNYGVCPPTTWAAAIAEQNGTGLPANLYVCEPYDWADEGWICGGDHHVLFAYDKATGKLMAAVELSALGAPDQQNCLAGPATIAPYGGCTAYYDCFPNDAGFPRRNCYGEDAAVDGPGHGG
jgi:hypothetical protein